MNKTLYQTEWIKKISKILSVIFSLISTRKAPLKLKKHFFLPFNNHWKSQVFCVFWRYQIDIPFTICSTNIHEWYKVSGSVLCVTVIVGN